MGRWLLFGLVLSLVSVNVICKNQVQGNGLGKMKNLSWHLLQSRATGQNPGGGLGSGGNQPSRGDQYLKSDNSGNGDLFQNPEQGQRQASTSDQGWKRDSPPQQGKCEDSGPGETHCLCSDENQSQESGEDLSGESTEDESAGTAKSQGPSTDGDKSQGSSENKSSDQSPGTDGDKSQGSSENKSSDQSPSTDGDPNEKADDKPDDDQDKEPDDDPEKKPDDDPDEKPDDDPDEKPDDDPDEKADDKPEKKPDGDQDEDSRESQEEDPEKDQDPHQYLQRCKEKKKGGVSDARFCMEGVNNILKSTKIRRRDFIKAMRSLERFLEETEVNDTASMSADNLVAFLYKPKGPFAGLDIYASENEATSEATAANSKVIVRLPREIDAGSNNTVVFCMLTWPETNETSDVLYEDRLVSVSVRGKNISGLQERVNITMNLTMGINESQTPSCRFLDFSTHDFSEEGCYTLWEPGQSEVTCSCDHLTYFGVLLVSPADVPSEHLEILSYITLIGCSLSLLVLVVTVLLFIIKRKVRADISMKVHINLAIALILLNVHFLPSHMVAAQGSSGLCFYFAIALHFSLLATFTWMALEGFHLYLLLVRVFNIYIRRYLLKLSAVGWGFPLVIVSLVVIIDRKAYGIFPLDSSNPNSTEICYITNTTVKMVTTVGVFSLVFCFNLAMLGVTIRRVVSLRQKKQYVTRQSGQIDRDRMKQDVCTLLGVTLLLGIPWGLVFFSFGYLTVPGLYAFCILNSLQGFFIFLWFLMSLRKFGSSGVKTNSKTNSKTQSTNS